jgi:hypothetical protein
LKQRALLSLILALTFWAPAEASDTAIQILPQQDAPVSIVNCSLAKQSVQIARGVSVEGLSTGIVFKNDASKTIGAVTFKFTMSDSSGAILENRFEHTTGTFSPTIVIDNTHWLNVDSWPTLGEMSCSVSRVSFQDGTVWYPQP